MKEVHTHSERGEGILVLDHLGPAVPTLGNEVLGTFKATLYCGLGVHILERGLPCEERALLHVWTYG